MTQRRPNLLIASFVLIWFGVIHTLFTSGVVVCQDAHGDTRIEWGCVPEPGAGCLDDECTDNDHVPSHPCEDTPVHSDQQATKAPPRAAAEIEMIMPAAAIAIVLWPDLPRAAPAAVMRSGPDRPPDALARLRTVVLLV